jgi:hypothetical protein
MSRLVMLPNARRVPEFLPVSPGRYPGKCQAAYRECQSHSRLRAKSPEADYLAAVRGIITGPLLVVPKQHTGYGSGRRPGGGHGRPARHQMFSGPLEGGIGSSAGGGVPAPYARRMHTRQGRAGGDRSGRHGCAGRGGSRAKYLMGGADDFSESARCDGACR